MYKSTRIKKEFWSFFSEDRCIPVSLFEKNDEFLDVCVLGVYIYYAQNKMREGLMGNISD